MKAFEDHLWDCTYCTEKWYDMQPYLQDVRQNSEELRRYLRASVAEKTARARPPIARQPRNVFAWFLSFRPAWQLAAVLLLVVGLTSGLFYFIKQEPILHPPSSVERSPIRLIEPLGSIERAPETFRWEPVAGAQSYRLKVQDDLTGATVQAQSNQPQSSLPTTSDFHFQSGQSYTWTVEALDENGRVLGKAEGYFKLAP
jgi:hypothetical protein